MVTRTGQSELPKDGAVPQAEEFEVLLVSDEEEPGYSVFVPVIPGCVSEGNDWDEALYMIQGAIELFLEVVGRPPAEAAEDAEQMSQDWTTQGYAVQTATVLVNLNAGTN